MTSDRTFRPPQQLLTPDQAIVKQSSETMERELIFGMLQSYRFYKYARNIICPYDTAKRTHRQDFKVDRYNTLFRAMDGWYRRFDAASLPKEPVMPIILVKSSLIDWANNNKVSVDVTSQLCQELDSEAALAAAITFDSSMALIQSPGFLLWLENRIVDYMHAELNGKKQLELLTLENLKDSLQRANLQLQGGQRNTHMLAHDVLLGRRKYAAALKSDLRKLDLALGGGWRYAETSMLAAINGGGKTVFTCQLSRVFALNGKKVALFTTERKPHELIVRIASNHLNVKINEFYDRQEIRDAASGKATEFSNLPEWLWTDPLTKEKMQTLQDEICRNILFVDWSQGQGFTLEKNLDAEVEAMSLAGFDPDVVIFDWIGGGLEQNKDKNLLRHSYQAGIDHFVSHGKRTNRVMIAAAQLDKKLVKENTTYISMSMVSECKGMTNNISNFVGITSLRVKSGASSIRLQPGQFLTVDKATMGPGGNVPVTQVFELQRFAGGNITLPDEQSVE